MTKKLSIFSQKNIILFWLLALMLGKSALKLDMDFTIVAVVLLVTTIISIKTIEFIRKIRIDMKNSLIIASIVLLLLWGIEIWIDLLILILILFVTFFLREVIRYRWSPIINTAVLFGLIIFGLSYILETGLFIGWSGMNYTIKAFWTSIPYATYISMLACLSIVIASKRYFYTLWFFISYLILGYALLGTSVMSYTLLDGTLYFFFWVMALEPKTGIYGKNQFYYGIALWLILVSFLEFHIPGDYLLALAIMNIVFFLKKYLTKNQVHLATYPKGQLWLCVPCGYIYDPKIGDTDSGIVAGTEFSDIPEDWRCPVCGVTKADFIPYKEGEASSPTYTATVREKIFLNPTTIEFTIETEKDFPSKPGQFMSFFWNDHGWDFIRSYSIARHVGNCFTFLIKLDDLGRGSHLLREILPGTEIRIRWVFGNFILQDTTAPKVFIATGTGLAPIYDMIMALSPEVPKSLYFTVATDLELFYTKQLRAIDNLDLHIHITREKVDGHEFGRVDVDTIVATPDTEWYLCGSPKMVQEAHDKLAKRGFESVYSEEFS